jgi:hypothetical protein
MPSLELGGTRVCFVLLSGGTGFVLRISCLQKGLGFKLRASGLLDKCLTT